jgi:hypothetical protein
MSIYPGWSATCWCGGEKPRPALSSARLHLDVRSPGHAAQRRVVAWLHGIALRMDVSGVSL